MVEVTFYLVILLFKVPRQNSGGLLTLMINPAPGI